MIFFYFISSLSIGLISRFWLIRNSSIFFNQGFSGDSSVHFKIIEACRAGKKEIINYVIPNKMSYPILFHQFCRIFPDDLIKKKNFLPNLFLYLLMASFLFFYFDYAGNKYIADFPEWGAFCVVIFFSFSVQNLTSIGPSIAYITLSARLMGKIGTSIFILGLSFFLAYGDILSFFISLCGVVIGFLSSIFASQVIIFSSIILSMMLLSIHPFILLILGLVLSAIFSKGYSISTIIASIKFLIIYKKLICYSRYHQESLSKFFSKKEIFKYISNFNLKKIFLLSVRSEPTRIFFFYPELVIISGWLILTDNSSNLFIQMASYIILSVCILYIIITTKYLNFLGEAYRYIEYALAGIGPILLSLMLFDISGSYNFFKILIFYSTFVFLWSNFLQKKMGYGSDPSTDHLGDFLMKLNIKKKDIVFPVSMRLGADIVARSNCKSFWWQPGGITDRNMFKEYIHEYPYLSTNWKKLSKKHSVTLIIVDKKALIRFEDKYNFSGLKKILESSKYIAYRYKKTS